MDFQKSLAILQTHRCPHDKQKEESPNGLFGQEIDINGDSSISKNVEDTEKTMQQNSVEPDYESRCCSSSSSSCVNNGSVNGKSLLDLVN